MLILVVNIEKVPRKESLKNDPNKNLSNESYQIFNGVKVCCNPGISKSENKFDYLGYIGDYTTQLYGDSTTPLEGSRHEPISIDGIMK